MQNEKTVSSETIFSGKIITVKKDKVTLPSGSHAVREKVLHNGGAAVVAIDESGNIILVRQYRYGVSDTLLELPAGKLEPGEDPAACAMRELKEETGCKAEVLHSLGAILPSPAYLSERIYLYCADSLTKSVQSLDEDEFVDIVRMPYREALLKCINGEFEDAKTVAGILRYNKLFAEKHHGF